MLERFRTVGLTKSISIIDDKRIDILMILGKYTPMVLSTPKVPYPKEAAAIESYFGPSM